jgi:5-methylcytosine-specific restriction endonuclease McrA
MKRRIDLKLNLDNNISSEIRRSLKGKKNYKKWETLVGYTKVDLIKRLKSTLPRGYVWQDFLDGRLHIDHTIPISAFNYNSPDQIDFKQCWALTNLRLLTEKENRIKGNELGKPFQPALKISREI